MKIRKYLANTLLFTTLGALCLLLSIDFFFAFINELRVIGTGDYKLLDALWFLILSIPQQGSQWFAFSMLLGTMLGLGLLEQQQELLIMRVSGMSIIRLLRMVIGIGSLMVLGMLCISEGIAPSLNELAQETKAYKVSAGQAMLTTKGMWFRDGDTFMHVQSIRRDTTLEGITQYELAKGGQAIVKVRRAKEGTFKDDHWHLKEVSQTEFLEDKLQIQYFKTYDWASKLDPGVLRIVGLKHLEELSMRELWQVISFRQKNNLERDHLLLTLWQKILQPFNALVLMLVAFPFVFGPLRQANVGSRWLAGILLGCLFYLFNGAAGSLSVMLHFPPLIGAMVPSILFLGGGLFLLRRIY